jgi:hypothetical protein
MTADIEDDTENRVFNDLVGRFVMPSVRGDTPRRGDPVIQARLTALLEEMRAGFSPVGAGIEDRMIPSVLAKGRHVPFRDRSSPKQGAR